MEARIAGSDEVTGSNPVSSTMNGHLAQLGEHLLDVEGVRGSSPLVSTISASKMPVKWAFFFYPWKNPWKIYGITIFCICDLMLC